MPNQTNDFKLLAIRPLQNCKREFCNNLEYNQLFQFYNSYEFIQNDDDRVVNIIKKEEDFDLYSNTIKEDNNMRINISAIVGKNGSGKSTLAELFYICCYLVATSNNLIISKSSSVKSELTDLERIRSGLRMEVFFKFGLTYFCLYINSEPASSNDLNDNLTYYNLRSTVPVPLANFFYTIAINYSIYGLNEIVLGKWVSRLFHKNDGYQTPLVLNPFRDKGNINVNAEIHFAQTRLLSNIQYDKTNLGEILPGGQIKEIAFDFEKHKHQKFEGYSTSKIIHELEKSTDKSKDAIFEEIYKGFLHTELSDAELKKTEWIEITINYVLTKCIRIAKNYTEYKRFYKTYTKYEIPGIQNFSEYINELKLDLSHITLKLRQALQFFKNDPLRIDDDQIRISQRRLTIPADLFAQRRERFALQHPERDPMEYTPIAPFTPKIILKGGRQFSKLSSGEQQYVHTIQAIIYHVLNVNSVFKMNDSHHSKIRYKYINLVLDEIELYFHPEFQRRFLNDLLKIIEELNIKYISGINILFLTHSPFILSDIPASNVLRLQDGKLIESGALTFAGNINQMLMNSFFMTSTTGDFAKRQYEAIVEFHHKVRSADKKNLILLKEQYSSVKEKFRFIVSQIAEDITKGLLQNHLEYLDKIFLELDDNKESLRRDLENQLAIIKNKLEELQ